MRLLQQDYSAVTKEEFVNILIEWCDLKSKAKPSLLTDYCICGHEVCQPFYVKNTINSNVIKMGGDCIFAFFPDFMKTVVGIVRDNNRYKGTLKMCGTCYKHKIPTIE